MTDQSQPTTDQQVKANPGRTQLLLMVGIMGFTLLGSYALFKFTQTSGGPWATVNKGEFVEGGVSVADFAWRTVERAPFAREFPEAFAPLPQGGQPAGGTTNAGNRIEGRQSVKRTWWLLAVANEGCDAVCQHSLNELRSLQVLLTKDATRVRRAVVLPTLTSDIAGELAAQYPRMMQLSPAADESSSVPAPLTGMYIVDPTGVMVLRYPLVDSAADMQKDLKRLLKYSQLG